MSLRRKGVLLLALFFISSMPYSLRTEYFYNLTKLKEARPPEKIRLVMVDNVGSGKPLIEEGLLFTFKDRKASNVAIAGNFSSWNPRVMTRGKDGVWFFFLPNTAFSGKVLYKFNVDGLWTEDPWNGLRQDDRQGSYISLAEIDEPSEGKHVTYKILKNNYVMFRFYKPEARIVSLVGDFNGWNPENDLMKKDKNGIWRLEKKLSPGTYRYKFIVDGQWMPDIFNPDSGTDNTGEICSILKMK